MVNFMDFNWIKIRSEVDPYSCLPHSKDDAFLFVSHKIATPFGREDEIEKRWLSSNREFLFAFFKEITLRQMLFEDYVNGDAIAGLERLNFSELLSLLIEGAKNGELDLWHDGLITLEEIRHWTNESDSDDRYQRLENILIKHNLNLHVAYYPSKKEALNSNERESLPKAISGNAF